MNILTEDLSQLQTEMRNPRTTEIDQLNPYDLITCLHEENYSVAFAISDCIFEISEVVRLSASRLSNGGRLFYFGAGTSGRIGVLDASECPPTFGVEKDLIQGIIAGGDHALRNSIEGAEDDLSVGEEEVTKHGISDRDVVIGIAASGRTPYVIGALRRAKQCGALTVAVVNVKPSLMEAEAEITIAAVTGPEPLTGSTRMKAGTAQKMVLNLISTGIMIQLGKTYSNLMVDVNATNEKLKKRAIRIVTSVTGATESAAEEVLEKCDWRAKTAIVMLRKGIDSAEAVALLNASNGFVRKALD